MGAIANQEREGSKVHTLCTFGADAMQGGSPYLIILKQDFGTNAVYA
jgi:hypothetical protein